MAPRSLIRISRLPLYPRDFTVLFLIGCRRAADRALQCRSVSDADKT